MSEPTDKDLPDEQQLDEYLQGGSSVSQQYRQLRSADVPAELDRLVLRQAQDAVKLTRPAKSRTWMRWSAPLAVAASAVLVVAIVIESGVQDEVMLSSKPASAPAPTLEAKRKSEAADSDLSESAAVEMRMPSPSEQTPAIPPRDVAPAYADAPEAPVSAAAPPPPPEMDRPSREEPRRERRVAPPPQAAPMRSPPETVVVNAQAFKQAQHALAANSASPSMAEQHAGPRDTVPQTTAISTTADAVAEREQAEELQQYSDPELWLRDIRQLRKDDKQADADREWRRFREAFPAYEVEESDTAREAR
jgi:hypothetical protein